MLLPPGVEAHLFEPKPSDIVKINEADIFIYTGKFMEPWVEGIIKGVTNRNLIVVDASKGTKMIPGVFHDADEPAGSLDCTSGLILTMPKLWSGTSRRPSSRKMMSTKVFMSRRPTLTRRPSELDAAYKTTLALCKSKKSFMAGTTPSVIWRGATA